MTRGGDTSGATTVSYTVSPDDSAQTPVSPDDFVSGTLPTGNVSFAAGTSEGLITILTQNDGDTEPNENFMVTLANATGGAQIVTSTITATIRNDDVTAYSIDVIDLDKLEGNDPINPTPFTFKVTRTGDTRAYGTVDYSVGPIENPATDDDFSIGRRPTGYMEFNPGQTERILIVYVIADSDLEQNEDFLVTLSNPTGLTDLTTQNSVILNNNALADIRNDDGAGPTQYVLTAATGDLPRAPISISVNLETACTGSRITQNVDDPQLSTMRQGISDLLKNAVTPCTKVAAAATYEFAQIYSESQMSVFARAKVSGGFGKANARFDFNSKTKKNKILVRYQQVYFTIDVDPPQRPASLFDFKRTTTDEIAATMPPGSLPLYVSTVKYGLMAFMLIESDYSFAQVAAAVQAEGKGFGAKYDVGGGFTATNVLGSSKMQFGVYGGSTQGLDQVSNGLSGFHAIISASKSYSADSPGVPLEYVLRNLTDHRIAKTSLASQYTKVIPLQIRQRVGIKLTKFTLDYCDDEGADSVEIDKFTVWVKGLDRKSGDDPGRVVNVTVPADPAGSILYYQYVSGGVAGLSCNPDYMTLDKQIILTFATPLPYYWELAQLDFVVYARDYDSDSADEQGWGSQTLYRNQFPGKHTISLSSADFVAHYDFEIELLPSLPSPP